MTSTRRSALALMLSLLLAAPILALDLPAPPSGYAWQELDEIGSALLVPDGWHFSKYEEGDKLAYYVTEELRRDTEPVATGITLSVMREVGKRLGVRASAFAQQYVAGIQQKVPAARTWQNDASSFRTWGAIYPGQGDDAGRQIYNLILANDRTGTAFLLVFETDAARWEAVWPRVEPVFRQLMLDDEV